MAEGKRNIIDGQELATNVVLKLQNLGMVPSFAWTGMDPGSEEVKSMPIRSYSDKMEFYSRTFEFWWDDWVHVYVELRKPYRADGPWNPAKLSLRGVLATLPDSVQREKMSFCFQYLELRVLLGLASGHSPFYHPGNSITPNARFWRGRYENEL